MSRKPTMTCAICKEPMWKGRGSRPDGEAAHNACRRALPKENRAKTCVDCSTSFEGKSSRCNSCRYAHAKKNAKGPCKHCDNPATVRGLCLTHYSYENRAKHGGRVYATHAKECERCRSPFETTTKSTMFCSLACAQRHRIHETTDLVKYLRPKVWLGSTLSPRNGGALVAGQCGYCPTYFVGAPGAKYCSERCSTNASWKRRYDRRGEFKVTDKLRLAIYERDNHICQLCDEPVDIALHYFDQMSATLDHIIPQSWMLIPDHSERNLRLAHRRCNSARGDGTNESIKLGLVAA